MAKQTTGSEPKAKRARKEKVATTNDKLVALAKKLTPSEAEYLLDSLGENLKEGDNLSNFENKLRAGIVAKHA